MSRKERIISITALIILALAAVALAIVLLRLDPAANDPKVKQKELSYDYFDTVTLLLDYSGVGDEVFAEYCRTAEQTLQSYHELCDIYNEYEGIVNLKTLNDNAGQTLTVSPELFEILEYSKRMYELTEGTLNVAMGAVLEIWHAHRDAANEDPFDDSDNTLPTQEALEAAAVHCDISKLVLDRENMTATLLDPEMSLDLGAVAKGYAVERAAQLLSLLGADGVVINAGGNVRMIGSPPSGKGWEVGIKDPSDPLSVIKRLTLFNTAAVTSGGYERYFTVDGKNYHHIIDTETLFPAEHHASVTVVHPDSAIADCLSTALFNCDREKGARIIEAVKNAGLGEASVEYVD